MPRKARTLYQGEYYHIISRGNDRQKLFRSRSDFIYYLEQTARYKEKFEISIVHYCLMENHVHMVLRGLRTAAGITKMMHGLQMVYAAHFKRSYRRTGHVFEDRFKHFHIESDAYLLECGRYVEKNPVRAGMIEKAGDYKWSSYRHYAYGERNPLITDNVLYRGLGTTPEVRQQVYREYVDTMRAYELIVDKYFKERILI